MPVIFIWDALHLWNKKLGMVVSFANILPVFVRTGSTIALLLHSPQRPPLAVLFSFFYKLYPLPSFLPRAYSFLL
jgi:undecaprenyl pyrophosphate phosphatase UppP